MMKIRRWVVVAALLFAAGASSLPWWFHQLEIDKCLDAGGAWNDEQRHCILEEPKT